jgi:small ligand-binding sensory domain FIST
LAHAARRAIAPQGYGQRMGVRIGCGLSSLSDPRLGALEAAAAADAQLGAERADLVVVFAAGGHLAEPGASLEAVHEMLVPDALIGCGAGGVLGAGRELEDGTGIAVWAAALDGGEASTVRVRTEPVDEGLAVTGLADLSGAAGAVLLPDPMAFPTEQVLAALTEHAPGVPVLGGMASGRSPDGEPVLFEGEDVVEDGGAVGVRFDGVELLPCVSQGAAPFGPELTITASEGPIILELAGKPALGKLRDVVSELPDDERDAVSGGLLVGIVVDGDKPEYVQGDFLVRGLVGADASTGAVAMGTPVKPGQVLRLHARDAASADRDLREALGLRREALGGAPPAGALLFSCNGRGEAMFGTPGHDARAFGRVFADTPFAGFFAAGEIGPVGGANFVHGFTATLAVFPG